MKNGKESHTFRRSWATLEEGGNPTTTNDPCLLNSKIEQGHQRVGHIKYQSFYHMTYMGLVTGTPKVPLLKKVITLCMLGKNARRKINPKIQDNVHSLTTSVDPLGPIYVVWCRSFLKHEVNTFSPLWMIFLRKTLLFFYCIEISNFWGVLIVPSSSWNHM